MGKWIILRLIQLNRREKCSQWKITPPVLSIEKIERRTGDGKKRNNLKILQLNIISIMNRKKVVSARISCKYRWETKEGHNKIQKATQPKNIAITKHEAKIQTKKSLSFHFSFSSYRCGLGDSLKRGTSLNTFHSVVKWPIVWPMQWK